MQANRHHSQPTLTGDDEVSSVSLNPAEPSQARRVWLDGASTSTSHRGSSIELFTTSSTLNVSHREDLIDRPQHLLHGSRAKHRRQAQCGNSTTMESDLQRLPSVPPELASPQACMEPPPKIRVSLLHRKLFIHVVGVSVFLVAFTAAAYRGIRIQKVTQEAANISVTAKVNADVEMYNTVSGFIMALVECILGMYMENFVPAFKIYLHNMLWFLFGDRYSTKTSARVRGVLLFVCPVVFMLMIGQSLRSFQATQSTIDYVSVMSDADLMQAPSTVELVKLATLTREKASLSTTADKMSTISKRIREPKRVGLGILERAVNGTSYPFRMLSDSPCGVPRQGLHIGLRDLNSASVVFGFPAREWYSEMLDVEPGVSWEYWYNSHSSDGVIPSHFDWGEAADMFASAKVQLDRLLGESILVYKACPTSSASTLTQLLKNLNLDFDQRLCAAAQQTLVDIGEYKASPSRSPEGLLSTVSTSLAAYGFGLDPATTEVAVGSYTLTDQVSMKTMVVTSDMSLHDEGTSSLYSFGVDSASLCGSQDCILVNKFNPFNFPRQVVLIPDQDCSYSDIDYSYDYRVFKPRNCTQRANSVVVIAVSSLIVGDFYGSDLSTYKPNGDASLSGPYVDNPRRRLRLTVSRINWTSDTLDEVFEAECRRAGSKTCQGLHYRLTQTGRYVFVSEDALPTREIGNASWGNPIRLVNLAPATFFIRDWGMQVMPERLWWGVDSIFEGWDWTKTLSGEQCSRYVDSFINHTHQNMLFIERPFSLLYQSALYYMFSRGSVTELNVTDALLNMPVNTSEVAKSDKIALDNVLLKGDTQYRTIVARVPRGTFIATLTGCCILLLLAVCVVLFPTRSVEYFSPEVTTPEQFLAMKSTEKYSNLLHEKTFLVPALNHESLPMEDFDVFHLTLVNREDPSESIRF